MNVDITQLTAGTSVFLPVLVEGALFSAGDGHFAALHESWRDSLV